MKLMFDGLAEENTADWEFGLDYLEIKEAFSNSVDAALKSLEDNYAKAVRDAVSRTIFEEIARDATINAAAYDLDNSEEAMIWIDVGLFGDTFSKEVSLRSLLEDILTEDEQFAVPGILRRLADKLEQGR